MIDRIGRESSLDYLPIDGATLTKMQRLDYFYIWRAEKKSRPSIWSSEKDDWIWCLWKVSVRRGEHIYVCSMYESWSREGYWEGIKGQFCYFVTNGLWHLLHVGYISAADQLSVFVNTERLTFIFILFNISECTITDNRSLICNQ